MNIESILAATGIKTRAELARVLGVAKPTAWRWKRLPLQHCAEIEHRHGLRCEAMRPDVTWHRDGGKVVSYSVEVKK